MPTYFHITILQTCLKKKKKSVDVRQCDKFCKFVMGGNVGIQTSFTKTSEFVFFQEHKTARAQKMSEI